MQVSLRPLVDADLDAIYEQMKDPESVRMAAFTPDDPEDRHAFLVHMSRVRDDPSNVQRVIEADGTIAGTIASFRIDDRTEVTYWIDRALWGRGIASAALQSLLSTTLSAHCSPAQPRTMPHRCGFLKRPGSDASESIATSLAVAERRSRRRSYVSTESMPTLVSAPRSIVEV
jgi:GNAT acetyltransferase-like protein